MAALQAKSRMRRICAVILDWSAMWRDGATAQSRCTKIREFTALSVSRSETDLAAEEPPKAKIRGFAALQPFGIPIGRQFGTPCPHVRYLHSYTTIMSFPNGNGDNYDEEEELDLQAELEEGFADIERK